MVETIQQSQQGSLSPQHLLCQNKDTKTRNEVCDKNMLTELNGIHNPTLRERMERGVVSTIIGTKKHFGWGLK